MYLGSKPLIIDLGQYLPRQQVLTLGDTYLGSKPLIIDLGWYLTRQQAINYWPWVMPTWDSKPFKMIDLARYLSGGQATHY